MSSFFSSPAFSAAAFDFIIDFLDPDAVKGALDKVTGAVALLLWSDKETEGSCKTGLPRLRAPDVVLRPQASPESLVPPPSEAFNGDNSPPSRDYSAPAWHVSLNTGLTVGRARATFSKHPPSGS